MPARRASGWRWWRASERRLGNAYRAWRGALATKVAGAPSRAGCARPRVGRVRGVLVAAIAEAIVLDAAVVRARGARRYAALRANRNGWAVAVPGERPGAAEVQTCTAHLRGQA